MYNLDDRDDLMRRQTQVNISHRGKEKNNRKNKHKFIHLCLTYKKKTLSISLSVSGLHKNRGRRGTGLEPLRARKKHLDLD